MYPTTPTDPHMEAQHSSLQNCYCKRLVAGSEVAGSGLAGSEAHMVAGSEVAGSGSLEWSGYIGRNSMQLKIDPPGLTANLFDLRIGSGVFV